MKMSSPTCSVLLLGTGITVEHCPCNVFRGGSRTRVDKVVIQVSYSIELDHMPNTFRLRNLLFKIDSEVGKQLEVAKIGFSRS
jgi:hypothetical protein